MGIKGGIARKTMKLLLGVPREAPYMQSEIGGDYDLDIVVVVDKATKDVINHVRKTLNGKTLAGMVLEAKDIEVVDEFYNYFRTRDVTQNEVLLFRESEDSATLYFTKEAREDCYYGNIAYVNDFCIIHHVDVLCML